MFRPADEVQPSPGASLEALPTERLEQQIVEVAGQLAATTCHWLALIAELDRRDAHEAWGFHSCSGWLAWQCSLDARAAREHVRVARRLTELPLVRESFGRGELSYSKVRAITRIATAETEDEMVELARQATASQLDRFARDYDRSMSAAAAFDAQEARYLDHHWDEDGCLRISGKLPPEAGVAFIRAIEAAETFEDADSADAAGSAEPAPPESRREPRARRADALSRMAEIFLGAGDPRGPGDSRGDRAPGDCAEVVVHVDAEALAGERPGRCDLENGPSIAAETARRLSCDSSLVSMLNGPQGPLSVGRRRRTIPPSTKRALATRDGCCRFPGCQNRRFVEGHHIRHWARGGETSLTNLVLLCTHHHRLVHEGGFGVSTTPGGAIRFHRPSGREVVPRNRPAIAEIAAPVVTPGAIRPLSLGEPIDREHAVWAMLTRAGPAG